MRPMYFSFLFLVLGPIIAFAGKDSASLPLDETRSAPATDLLFQGVPIDRDQLLDLIRRNEIDSSTLEPQTSRVYRAESLDPVGIPDLPYPDPKASETDDSVDFGSMLPSTSGLVRARVNLHSDPRVAFQMNLSLDAHSAMARNALLRRLGYLIPSPKYYSRLRITFSSFAERDRFLDRLSSDTLTSRNRWLPAGYSPDSNVPDLILQDLVLEPAQIEVPQLHWGILTPEVLNGRRSLRATLVPLTLLDIPESVNLFSFEPAKVFNDFLVFKRPGADAFQNETTIGDARWIARKIAKLSRSDWEQIIRAGHYPPDVSALILEKTLARVNELMKLLSIREFKALRYDPKVTVGSVIKGKATREKYEGYALRFTYGDPLNPLRSSELARFFGVTALNSALTLGLEQANKFLQVRTPEDRINAHRERVLARALEHYQNHPNEPYVQPLEIWGGPVGGANIHAARNVMTGTYYGSDSQIQLVDTFSAAIDFGGFFGVSGIPRIGVAVTPGAQASRNYVHVRPLPDLRSAWKENWANVFVPGFMIHLSKVLAGETDSTSTSAVKEFLDSMTPGELFIVTDSFLSAGTVSAQVPLGALIGFLPSFGVLEGSVSMGGSYGVLARTTLMRTTDGVQVYLQRIRNGSFELQMDSRFFIRIFEVAQNAYSGRGHTEAFVFPEKFDHDGDAKLFQQDIRKILVWNLPDDLRDDFDPYHIDHKTRGHRLRFGIGPFSWVRRHNFHRIEIKPPMDALNRYRPEDHKRTVVEGQLTKILGSDPWGFLGSAARAIEPLLNLSSSFKGDDPSSNFLGKSRSFMVNTQIETTSGKSHDPFMKIERAFTGWSLRKSRLLRLIKELSSQVAEHQPGSSLINPDEFTQTRKIQAYRLNWNLLIYPGGIERLLEILNLEKTGTLQTQNLLIRQMGEEAYRRHCEERGLRTVASRGPYSRQDINLQYGMILESSRGQTTYLGCVTPFMLEVYRLRSKLSGKEKVVFAETKNDDEAKERIRLLNLIASALSRAGDIGDLIGLVGKENSFFQARISGYRTRDENGDSDYFSNTIGLIDQELLTGPLSDIAADSKISSNEIEARYLSNGY
ncbi:MAG: hypothetical protein KGP28_04830 [Bdellovibrionales bacterium]|nr:hypothetical protein [Bdellovibrionales bacterium]